MLTGLWVNRNTYRFTHPGTKRSLDIIIPGTELMTGAELDEIIEWQREEVEQQLCDPEKPKLTRDQGHDLGATLIEIRASKRHRRETGHGRWW